MKQRWRLNRAEQLVYLALAMVVYACLAWQVLTLADSGGAEPAWAGPSVMAVRRVSAVPSAQSEPNSLDNMDCSLVTYRLVNSTAMQTGCFTETAFGLFDSDVGVALVNGTDEGVPLLAYSPGQALAPWPDSSAMISLDATVGGGSYISLYKNPLAVSKDIRNVLFQLTAKQLTAAPDLPLTDRAGQRLVINAQTLAFSDGGSWMIVETINNVFLRINLATLDVKPFAPGFGTASSPGLLKARVAISDDGHYAAITNDDSHSFRVYNLTACSGGDSNLQAESCPMHDYRSYIESQIPDLRSIRHVRFVNNGLVSFEALTYNVANSAIYELAPRSSIDSLTDYLGLGDSYTSGEGAFNYLAGTDTADDLCHLSIHSYPLLLTRDLFSARGGHSVACSGAVIQDVATKDKTYKGQISNGLDLAHLQSDQPALLNSVMTNFVPGYVAQHRFVAQYLPAVTTVSVGGDDIGFGDILARCVIPHLGRHPSDNICFNTYEDRLELTNLIDRTVPRWTRLFNQLQAEAPDGRLYVIGYPSIISDIGSCGLNVNLNQSELEFSEEIIVYLNGAIEKSAKSAGAIYVDISQALVGHRLCEAKASNIAVNGLTAGKDIGVSSLKFLGRESYHPNALGQQLIEQTILDKTRNLTLTTLGSNVPALGQHLFDVPKSGRTVTARVPSSSLTTKIVKSGRPTAVKASGKNSGLKSKTTYSVHLDGPTGPVIGSSQSDDNGDLDLTVTVPADTVPGGHSIDVTGENQSGEPTDVTQPVYVPVSDSDSDGDGQPDTVDSCPAAVNSGVDEDQDGIDDTCDGYIGPPPVVGSMSGSASGTLNSGGVVGSPPNGAIYTTAPNSVTTFQTISPSESVRGRVLGTATTNPQTLSPNPHPKLTNPIYKLPQHGEGVGSLHKKVRINWGRWILFGCLLWLILVLLGIAADIYVAERKHFAYN
jgi:hypothetical protein